MSSVGQSFRIIVWGCMPLGCGGLVVQFPKRKHVVRGIVSYGTPFPNTTFLSPTLGHDGRSFYVFDYSFTNNSR